ncbi:MAG: metallophosphoesterase family protein [Chloroflexota bacterium]
MRVALLSDIHANSIALDAVLQDIEAQGGASHYWILGDMVPLGPDPLGVIERLMPLPNVQFIHGNGDRYTWTGDRPTPTLEQAKADPDKVVIYGEVMGTFPWTQGMLTAAGWFEWLGTLPLEMRHTLPDGTRFLGVHASPGSDDSEGIHPALNHDEIYELVKDCDADLICVGHTHMPLSKRVGPPENQKHVVNLGSISNGVQPDIRASYVLLDADEQGYTIIHRRVAYDYEAVIAQMERLKYPSTRYLTENMRGLRVHRNYRPGAIEIEI